MAPPPAISANPAIQDISRWLTSRLSEPWSAPAVSPLLTKEILEKALVYFRHLDPLVRVGLILACLTLRRGVAMEMKAELEQLAAKALEDDDDWVKSVGAAVGRFCGTLELGAVEDQFPSVSTSLQSLRLTLDKLALSDRLQLALSPKENAYLCPHVLPAPVPPRPSAPSHHHFRLRQKTGGKNQRVDDGSNETDTGRADPRGNSAHRAGNHIVGSYSTSHLQQIPSRHGLGLTAFGSSSRGLGPPLGRSSSCSAMLRGGGAGAGGKKPKLKQLDVSDVIALQRLQSMTSSTSSADARRADGPPPVPVPLSGASAADGASNPVLKNGPSHPLLKKRHSHSMSPLPAGPGKKRPVPGGVTPEDALPSSASPSGNADAASPARGVMGAGRAFSSVSDPTSPSPAAVEDASLASLRVGAPVGGSHASPVPPSQEEGEIEGEEDALVAVTATPAAAAVILSGQESAGAALLPNPLDPRHALGGRPLGEDKRGDGSRGGGVALPFLEGAALEEERRRQEGLSHVTEALSEALSKAGGGSSIL
eukprot:jgi/Mesvir1/13194/Mv06154-RA.1